MTIEGKPQTQNGIEHKSGYFQGFAPLWLNFAGILTASIARKTRFRTTVPLGGVDSYKYRITPPKVDLTIWLIFLSNRGDCDCRPLISIKVFVLPHIQKPIQATVDIYNSSKLTEFINNMLITTTLNRIYFRNTDRIRFKPNVLCSFS